MIPKTKHVRLILLMLALMLAVGVALTISRGNDKNNSAENSQKSVGDTQNQSPAFDKDKHSIDDPASIWVIVNKSRPLSPLSFAPNDLIDAGNGQLMRQDAAAAFQEMIKAASAEGLSLQPLSGYRSYQTQQAVYAREVDTYGQTIADTQSAKPGHSEHQTGLTMDVGGGGCGIEDCFGDTTEGKWVAANAHTYGFIIRYPEGKEAITGYRYEPWHIRYVGKELAAEMKQSGSITLEEFFSL